MKSNTYSPAQVSDPTSENHLVRLYPNQDLRVVLSQDSEDVQIFLTSRFLRLSREEQDKKGNRVYHFVQQYDLSEWAAVSSAYLGEVAILRKNSISSVCVMLEGQNAHNRDMITVVNPIGSEIKIEPHQVLEVVVFDCDGDFGDKWEYEIHTGDDEHKVQYQYIGKEVVYPSVQYKTYVNEDDLEDMTLVMPRSTKDTPIREHHFYFRCSYDSLVTLKNGSNGSMDGGKLCFHPKAKVEDETTTTPQFKFVLSLCMNVRDRNRGKMFNALFFPKKFHIVSTPQCLRNAASEKIIYPKRESGAASSVIDKTTYAKSNWNHSHSYSRNHSYNTSANSSGGKTAYAASYRSSISVPNIVLKPKRTKDIDTGCRIAYCVRTNKKKRNKVKNNRR